MIRGALVVLLFALLGAGPAAAAEPIGVITELHLGDGRVEVKPGAGGDWQTPQPLLAIHAGDQIRASGGARAVLVFMASPRSTVVTQDNSPFTAAAPASSGLGERVRSALTFLQSTPREPSRVAATVRGEPPVAPMIVAPRETFVSPGAVTLDFSGPARLRYAARILASDGRVLWERKDLPPRPLTLTAGDVTLAPGRYHWELQTPGHGVERASFDVPTAEEAARAKAAVDEIDAARYPPATATLLRAAALMRERFYADARAALLAAIAAAPGEPTLHLLLAHLYQQTGPEPLAEREFGDAAVPSGR